MRVLLVSCHPRSDSFTGYLADRARNGLVRAGHEVTHLDLYAAGFRAAMSREERQAYHGDQPVLDPMVAEHIEALRAAETLVFVYPTWWAGLPAMLKGWLERVMVPGVGFRFDEKTGKARPNLTTVRRVVGISTYGSPRWYVKLIQDNGRRTLMRALRLSCGLPTRGDWHAFYAIDSSTEEERIAFADRVDVAMGRLR